jgi:hypothetical protein
VWVFLHPLLRTLDRPVDLRVGESGEAGSCSIRRRIAISRTSVEQCSDLPALPQFPSMNARQRLGQQLLESRRAPVRSFFKSPRCTSS